VVTSSRTDIFPSAPSGTTVGLGRDCGHDGGDSDASRAALGSIYAAPGWQHGEFPDGALRPVSLRLCLGGLVALVLVATARSWGMPFLYDDLAWTSQPWSLATAPYRLALVLGGGLPWAVHGMAVALHVLNGALFWRLTRRWLSPAGALMALTLFWLHPLPLQAVFYVTGSREVWLTTWALVALLGGLRGGWGWLVGAFALLAAVTIKASALPLVVAIPLVWACARGYGRLTFLSMVCVGLSASWPVVMTMEGVRLWAVSLWGALSRVVWIPNLSIVHDTQISPMVGMAVIAAVVLTGVATWRRPLWWAWLWVVGVTAPRAFTGTPSLTDAHVYVPNLAIWILGGVAVDAYLKRGVV
jgi:hypothetical protein